MKTSNTEVVTATPSGSSTLARRLGAVLAQRAEEILAENAPTLRRLRTLLLVAAISVPVFLGGMLVVLWRLAR